MPIAAPNHEGYTSFGRSTIRHLIELCDCHCLAIEFLTRNMGELAIAIIKKCYADCCPNYEGYTSFGRSTIGHFIS